MSDAKPVKVYFLGSGNLGKQVLTALSADSRICLCGIGSQPDRQCGRGHKYAPTALASHAMSLGFEVERLESVNTEEFAEKLRLLGVEILLVVAFGQLLKAPLLALPMFGCLNVHASLLPRYRGACPINAAILNGDRETGVSFMAMNKGLDTGPVYHVERLEILPEENAEELESRLGELAAAHIGDVCWRIAREGLAAVPQPDTSERNVRKISKSDGAIDWNDSAELLVRKMRAFCPWPGLYFDLPQLKENELRRVKLYSVAAEPSNGVVAAPGTILPSRDKKLRVACGEGVLVIDRMCMSAKLPMDSERFLCGVRLLPGMVLASVSHGG